MLKIVEIYDDVAFRINKDQNGDFTYAKFNGASRLAENRLLDWLSGDVENQKPPIPYLSQKNRDWLAPLITPATFQVSDGIVTRPADYYGFENLFRIGSKIDCEDDEEEDDCNTTITLVSGLEFDSRCTSDIEELRPSMQNPIVKEIGNRFYTAPKTIGSVTLEYIKYPIYGKIITKKDAVYNDEVPDVDKSVNYVWNEDVREVLVYLIAQEFSIHIRESALQASNREVGKLIRDEK